MLEIRRTWGQEFLIKTEDESSVINCILLNVTNNYIQLRVSGDLNDFHFTIVGGHRVCAKQDFVIYKMTAESRLDVRHNSIYNPLRVCFSKITEDRVVPMCFYGCDSLKVLRTELMGVGY